MILSRTLLIAATPLFLLVAWLVVVVWPNEVVRGLASVMSDRDVIQVADGTYVYVGRSIPDGCAAVQAILPPNQLIAERREPFDLPR